VTRARPTASSPRRSPAEAPPDRPGPPGTPANERLRLPQPFRPGGRPRLPRIARGQQPLDDRAGAQDAPLVADVPDLGPATQGADQPAPHQLGAPTLGESRAQIGAGGLKRDALRPPVVNRTFGGGKGPFQLLSPFRMSAKAIIDNIFIINLQYEIIILTITANKCGE